MNPTLDEQHDRILELVGILPPDEWTTDEAGAVVDVLAGLVAAREAKTAFGGDFE